jgi:hypothetical protein
MQTHLIKSSKKDAECIKYMKALFTHEYQKLIANDNKNILRILKSQGYVFRNDDKLKEFLSKHCEILEWKGLKKLHIKGKFAGQWHALPASTYGELDFLIV